MEPFSLKVKDTLGLTKKLPSVAQKELSLPVTNMHAQILKYKTLLVCVMNLIF